MSGSELAPFVAAVLESKVVKEVEEENKKLKQEKKTLAEEVTRTRENAFRFARRKGGWVEITGEGGSPVYARGFLEDAVFHGWRLRDGSMRYCIDTELELLEACPIRDAMHSELHLNGVKIAHMNKDGESSYDMKLARNRSQVSQCYDFNCPGGWESLRVEVVATPLQGFQRKLDCKLIERPKGN